MNKGLLVRPFPFFFSCLLLIVSLFSVLQENELIKFISVLEIFLYLLIYVLWIDIFKYYQRMIGMFVALLTTMRYCVIPIMIIFSKEYLSTSYFGSVSNDVTYISGTMLTIWEMICVGFFVKHVYAKWYQGDSTSVLVAFPNQYSEIMYYLLVVLFGALVLTNPVASRFFSSIFNIMSISNDSIVRASDNSLGVIMQFIVRAFRILIPIPIAMGIYRKYQNKPRKLYVILTMMVFFIPYGTMFEGTSRNSIIIPIIALLFLLPNLFPTDKKFVFSMIFIALCTVAVVMIAWKSFLRFGLNIGEQSSYSMNPLQYLELYFAGPSNVGKAVLAREANSISLINRVELLLDDIFCYVPFLNKLVDSQYTTNYLFLDVWGRYDQVIPAIGNGLFYVGYLLSPIVPMINLQIARIFEKRIYEKNNNLAKLAIFSYSAAMLSYNTFNNISSLYMKLFLYVLPVVLIYYGIESLASSLMLAKHK